MIVDGAFVHVIVGVFVPQRVRNCPEAVMDVQGHGVSAARLRLVAVFECVQVQRVVFAGGDESVGAAAPH